jgi:hypothetical protein
MMIMLRYDWQHWAGDRNILERVIHETTVIPLMALPGVPLSNFSVDGRMRWGSKRKTKRKEDKAYCLLGIFGVFMSPIYGEGDNAFIRLKDKIDRFSGSKIDSDKLLSAQSVSPIWYIPLIECQGSLVAQMSFNASNERSSNYVIVESCLSSV